MRSIFDNVADAIDHDGDAAEGAGREVVEAFSIRQRDDPRVADDRRENAAAE